MTSSGQIGHEFEKSLTGGIKYLKTRMKETHEVIQKKNQHAEEVEQQTIRLKEGYVTAVQSQKSMHQQISDNEERLQVVDRQSKEMKKRLYEKEELLRECKSFKASPSIEEAAKVDLILEEKKKLFQGNHEKFIEAKQRKIDLETKTELMECKSRAVTSKLNYLTSELHHAILKGERRKEECKQIAEIEAVCSSKCKEMEEGINSDTRKLVVVKQRVTSLLADIESKEDEIRSIQSNRSNMERTITNILRKIREQEERNRTLDVAYTLNKDSFVS